MQVLQAGEAEDGDESLLHEEALGEVDVLAVALLKELVRPEVSVCRAVRLALDEFPGGEHPGEGSVLDARALHPAVGFA